MVWVEDGNDSYWSEDFGPCECTDHGERGARALGTRNGANLCGMCYLGNHTDPQCPTNMEPPLQYASGKGATQKAEAWPPGRSGDVEEGSA